MQVPVGLVILCVQNLADCEGAPDAYTLVLLGASGKGKNALICRLFGLDPLKVDKTFGFRPSHKLQGTAALEFGLGYFLGKPELGKLRIINTPGLGNYDPDPDSRNLAAMRGVVEHTPIHMIVVVSNVLDAKIEQTAVEELEIILNKISPADWHRICLVENHYGFTQEDVLKRQETIAQELRKDLDDVTPRDFMNHKVQKYITYVEMSETGELQISDKQLDVFVEQFVFLDSNFRAINGSKATEKAEKAIIKLVGKVQAIPIDDPLDIIAARERELKEVHRATVEVEKKAKEHEEEAKKHQVEAERHRKEAADHEKEANEAKAAEGESSERAKKAQAEKEASDAAARAAEERANKAQDEGRAAQEQKDQALRERDEAQSSKNEGFTLAGFLKAGLMKHIDAIVPF